MQTLDKTIVAKLRQFNVFLDDKIYTQHDLALLDFEYVSINDLISNHCFSLSLLYRFESPLEYSRVKFENLSVNGNDVKRYMLGKFILNVISFLDRRNVTFDEFKLNLKAYHRAAAAKQYAKRKAVRENEKPKLLRETKASAHKLNQVIDIINMLTCKHPKAHAAFQAKLNPLGVYLPAITSQSNDEGESPK